MADKKKVKKTCSLRLTRNLRKWEIINVVLAREYDYNQLALENTFKLKKVIMVKSNNLLTRQNTKKWKDDKMEFDNKY